MTIEEFVDNDEYLDSFQYRMDWNGYKVYYAWFKAYEGTCTGYPHFALERNGEIRLSELEETIKIMDTFPYTDEEDQTSVRTEKLKNVRDGRSDGHTQVSFIV